MDPNSGKISYSENEEQMRKEGKVAVPKSMFKAAKEAFDEDVSLFDSKDKEARRWAKAKADKIKNRRRKSIAKASKKKNR